MRHRVLVLTVGFVLLAGRAAHGDEPAPKAGPTADGPLTFKTKAGFVYVESDRQRVTGLDADGKVLWHKDVTAVVALKARGDRPARVVWLGAAADWMTQSMERKGKPGEYVAILLSTKEGGAIDVKTGEYTSMGND